MDKEQIHSIYENALETILVLEEDGKIIAINQYDNFAPGNHVDLTGTNIFSLLDTANSSILLEMLSSKMYPKGANAVRDLAFGKPKGKKVWYEVKCLPVHPHSGHKTYFLFARDVSGKKSLEDQLKRINQNLEKTIAEKTTALQEAVADLESFSFSVSHDLKAPLRALKGYTGILLEELAGQGNEDVADAISSISRNVIKMEKLINDILSFSRIGRTEASIKPVDFKKIFSEKYAELIKLEPVRHIDFKIDAKLPILLFDEPMARLMVQNLLSNAIKYTSKKEFAEISVEVHQKRHEIVVSVRDNGAGFDEKFKHKLFGVFQRLHSERDFPGTGVGLAIVRRIARKHGGAVFGEGKVGKGAVFYIILPKKLIYHE